MSLSREGRSNTSFPRHLRRRLACCPIRLRRADVILLAGFFPRNTHSSHICRDIKMNTFSIKIRSKRFRIADPATAFVTLLSHLYDITTNTVTSEEWLIFCGARVQTQL